MEEYIVEALIEIPQGSVNKYEYHASTGAFYLDRVLYSPVHYPAEYGFIPGTLAPDGDPLDIIVLISAPTFPGCRVKARVIGCLVMAGEKGTDHKIISVAAVDPRFNGIDCLEKLPPHIGKEIEYFFSIYKDLEGKPATVSGWIGKEEAVGIIEHTSLPLSRQF